MKVFDVYGENILDNKPVALTRIRGTKPAVRGYLRAKFGEAFAETALRKTKHGYSYEIRPFTYIHFTSEFT